MYTMPSTWYNTLFEDHMQIADFDEAGVPAASIEQFEDTICGSCALDGEFWSFCQPRFKTVDHTMSQEVK
jgi:hypothetical protein